MANWNGIIHFSPEEFLCPCCGREEMDLDFVRRLDRARQYFGKPIDVLSGFRCRERNQAAGGSAGSAHLRGLAADLKCEDSSSRLVLLQVLLHAGFVRLGLGPSLVHVDADPGLPQNVLWLY